MGQYIHYGLQASFRRWLVHRGRFHEAALMAVMSRLGPGEPVNMDEVRREEEALAEERRQRQQPQGTVSPSDPSSQNAGDQFSPSCPPM